MPSPREPRSSPEPAPEGELETNSKRKPRASKPLTRGDVWAVLGFLTLAGLIAGDLWHSYLSFRVDPEPFADCVVVSGRLESAHEAPREQMDIRIAGDPLRYRMLSDAYSHYFQRDAFFTQVHRGDAVELRAISRYIAQPNRSTRRDDDGSPTVFIRGVSVGGRDYNTTADHIAWQHHNHRGTLTIAILISFCFVFLTIPLWLGRKEWLAVLRGGGEVAGDR